MCISWVGLAGTSWREAQGPGPRYPHKIDYAGARKAGGDACASTTKPMPHPRPTHHIARHCAAKIDSGIEESALRLAARYPR